MKRFKARQIYLLFIFILSGFLITGCGGGGEAETGHWLPPRNLVSIEVTPATASIPINGTQPFMATATYSDGSSSDVTASSSWTSGTAGVATVNPTSGVAIGVASGTSVITANFGDKAGSATLTVTGATLGSIAVTPPTASVPIGGTQPFTATATYSDGSSSNVTGSSNWTSGATGVATVDPTSGVAKGVTSGTLVITATFGGKTGSATLTVTTATLVSIAVTPVDPTLQIGATRQLTVLATYSDGTTRDVTTTTRFVSAAPAKATVSDSATVGASNGLTTGVAAGSSLITATFGGKTATTTVTVAPAALSFITVTPTNSSIAIGDTTAFVATGTYSDGTSAIISNTVLNWSSSSTLVATVLATGVGDLSTGVASGVTAGTVTITATSPTPGGKTGSATLIVTPAKTLLSITVTPTNSSIAIGDTTPFVALGIYSDGTSAIISNTVLSWSSSNAPVATVLATGVGDSSTGVASGVTAGTVTITATSPTPGGKTGSATLIVTPAKTLLSITVLPANDSVAIDGTKTFVATGTYSDSTSAVIPNSQVSWSATVGVATVLATGADAASTGVATGKSAGTATIKATSTIDSSKSGSATLIVTPAKTLLSITVLPATSTIAVGGKDTFVAWGTYSDGSPSAVIPNSDVTWSSNNTPVATVLATGVATGESAGTATIKATSTIDSSKSGSATLIVTAVKSLLSITVTPPNPTIGIGGTQVFVASGVYSDGTTVDNLGSAATWTWDKPLVASFQQPLGVATFTGLSAGTTAIVASSGTKSGNATLTVTSAPVLDILAPFAIASAGGITNGAATTKINGDVVLDPLDTCNEVAVGVGDNFGLCGGTPPINNAGDLVITPTHPDTTTAHAVRSALLARWNSLSPAILPGATVLGCGTIGSGGGAGALIGCAGNSVLPPGTYISSSNSSIGVTGNLTLDALGDPNAVFVFQAPSAVTTAVDSKIILTGGAKASNVWWYVGSSATLNSGSIFQGNILASAAISMGTGATSCGRLLSGAEGAGAFTFLGNTVSVPGHPNAPAGCE